jgi:hypothetical protein
MRSGSGLFAVSPKEIVPALHPRVRNAFSIAYVSGQPDASKRKPGIGSEQLDKFTMESLAAKPATCSTREHLQRVVEEARADYERRWRLLREEANYASLCSQTDEARLKWQGARLALTRHMVEHGCSKRSGARRWKYL